MLNTNGTIRVYNPDKKDVLIPNSGFTLTEINQSIASLKNCNYLDRPFCYC